MRICPECSQRVDDDGVLLADTPRGYNPAAPLDAGWQNVARVNNLAEAGYLASTLSGDDIDARIVEIENFSAVAGRWTAKYLIRVPENDVQSAAAIIRAYVDEEPADETYYSTAAPLPTEGGPVDAVIWRPVAVLVIAGVASFMLGQRFAPDRPANQLPIPRNSLPAAVDAIGRSFATEPAAGQPRHRLSFQRRHHCWYLETDGDGDGHFESRQRFRTAGAAW